MSLYVNRISAAKLRPWLLSCPFCHWPVKSHINKKASLIIDSVKNSKEELEPDLGGCIPELGSGQVRKAGVRQQSKLSHAEHWPERWPAEAKLCLPKWSWSLNLTFLSAVLMLSDSFKSCCFTRQWAYLCVRLEWEKKEMYCRKWESGEKRRISTVS